MPISSGGGASTGGTPLPAGASTEATLAAIKAKTDNIDVALSTRTKPADTQKVDGSAVTQPVSGTVGVSGTVPVSGPLTDAQLRAAPVPVSGTFFQATQPVSAAALPLPTGAALEAGNLATMVASLAALVLATPGLGQALMSASTPVTLASDQITMNDRIIRRDREVVPDRRSYGRTTELITDRRRNSDPRR